MTLKEKLIQLLLDNDFTDIEIEYELPKISKSLNPTGDDRRRGLKSWEDKARQEIRIGLIAITPLRINQDANTQNQDG